MFRISILVSILNNCFRLTPSDVMLSKLIVLLQLEHVLMDGSTVL